MLQADEPCPASAKTHPPGGVGGDACVSADYTGALAEARALAKADGRTAASLDVLLGLPAHPLTESAVREFAAAKTSATPKVTS